MANSYTKNQAKRFQKNVFAPSMGDLSEFELPIFDISPNEAEFLKEAILQNFLFSTLKPEELQCLISAFEKISVPKDTVIIEQGDQNGDYFYVIQSGTIRFEVNGVKVGSACCGQTFGELSLLYTAPRAATCIAESEIQLFRVDQRSFKYVLQSQAQSADAESLDLLKEVPFLKDLARSDLTRIVKALQPRPFCHGQLLVKKGEEGDALYIIQEGSVHVTDIEIGGETYEDQFLGPGDYFGERALVTDEPRTANCTGASQSGMALCIDKATFKKILGSYGKLVLRANDKRKLVSWLFCGLFCGSSPKSHH